MIKIYNEFFKMYQIYLFLSSYPKTRDHDFNKGNKGILKKFITQRTEDIVQIRVPFIDDSS